MVNTEGGFTRHLPDGAELSIFEASAKYIAEGVPLVILAGKEYGSGSSRDWAAKGPRLLGVQAVIAESYERIHRSNLVGMGILPLQFLPGQKRRIARTNWRRSFRDHGNPGLIERFELAARSAEGVEGRQDNGVQGVRPHRHTTGNAVLVNRGILQYVLRQLLATARGGGRINTRRLRFVRPFVPETIHVKVFTAFPRAGWQAAPGFFLRSWRQLPCCSAIEILPGCPGGKGPCAWWPASPLYSDDSRWWGPDNYSKAARSTASDQPATDEDEPEAVREERMGAFRLMRSSCSRTLRSHLLLHRAPVRCPNRDRNGDSDATRQGGRLFSVFWNGKVILTRSGSIKLAGENHPVRSQCERP